MAFSNFNRSLLFFAFVFSIAGNAYPQPIIKQSPLVYEQKEVWYDQIVSIKNSTLINGPEYFTSFNGRTSHPFFGSLGLSLSEVWFDQQLYKNVNLLYDIYSDKLILRNRDRNGFFVMIELDQSKIEKFNLYQHHFQKMNNPKSPGDHADLGYYDMLYQGKQILLVSKRTKVQQTEGSNVEYKLDDHYYMVRDNQWEPVKGLNDIIKLMPSNGKDIQAFVKSRKINVRKRNESDLVTLAQFCDATVGSSK